MAAEHKSEEEEPAVHPANTPINLGIPNTPQPGGFNLFGGRRGAKKYLARAKLPRLQQLGRYFGVPHYETVERTKLRNILQSEHLADVQRWLDTGGLPDTPVPAPVFG
jgi:hypothetical protein